MIITKRPLFYWILHRLRFLQFLLFLVILVSLFFRVFPLEMQKRIINTAIRLKDHELLFLYCALYFGAVILAGALKYVTNVWQRYMGQKILVEIRRDLYEHILRMPLQFYRGVQPGTVINSLTAELNAVGVFLGNALAVPVSSVLTFFAFAGYMIYLDLRLGLISLTIYPIEIFIIPFLQKKYNHWNKTRVKVTRSMSNTVNEAISGIHEVHGNASYKLEQSKLDSSINELFAIMHKLFILKFGIKFVNNLIQSFGPFLLFLYGGYLAINGQFTLGALVAFLSAYEKVYDPWKEMVEYYQEYQDAKVRYQQVMDLFNIEPEYALAPDDRKPLSLNGEIKIKDLDYTVSGGVKLINNISLSIPAKKQVALVGFSGSGKSTLALLIGQLYSYSKGKIQLDGNELMDLTKADISKNIGFVAQHPFIFTGTIRENLLYSCRASELNAIEGSDDQYQPSQQQVLKMVTSVGFKEDIVRFGLNTALDEDTSKSLVPKILQMRQILAIKKGKQLQEVVEQYNVNAFLRQATLYENIVFGEFKDHTFSPEKIGEDASFTKFLQKEELYEPIFQLGLNLAQQTVSLFQDFGDDEFFLQASPIEPGQFAVYQALVERTDSSLSQNISSADKALTITLAMRFIPARHKMVSLPPAFEEKIVATRHRFMEEIGGVDVDECRRRAQQIIVGGPDLVPLSDHKNYISYCPTEYQFTHSLLDNIMYGNITIAHKADTTKVIETVVGYLEEEDLLEEIMNIGLDFHVGSKGDRLSGGQKQKVALARVLLKNAPILIMDEATASLDNASQARVQEMMKTELKGKSTVVTVIHRLDMAPDFDKIIVLRAGRIVEEGSYDELMDKKGAFYDLATGP